MVFSSTSKIETGDTFWKTLKLNINGPIKESFNIAYVCATIGFCTLLLCFAISLALFNKQINASLFNWLGKSAILAAVAQTTIPCLEAKIDCYFKEHRLNAPEAQEDLKDLLKYAVTVEKALDAKIIPTMFKKTDVLNSKTEAELHRGIRHLCRKIKKLPLSRVTRELKNCADQFEESYLSDSLSTLIIRAVSALATVGICIRPVYQSFSR